MVKRLVQIYGYRKYSKANMLLTRSFDLYGDERGDLNPEPTFLNAEATSEILESMTITGNPIYVEADVNKKNHSNLTRVDWSTADFDKSYADENDLIENSNNENEIRDALNLPEGERLDLPVGLEIPEFNSLNYVDKEKPLYSAIDNGSIDSGFDVFDKEPESFAADKYIPHSTGYKDSLLSPEASVLVAKGDSDIHLMQYDFHNNKVSISDINDLPEVLQANLRMTYLSHTDNLDNLVVLSNVHTNAETVNDDVVKETDQKTMPSIAREYLFLTTNVRGPQGNIIDMSGIIDDKARENGNARLELKREQQRQREHKQRYKPVDDSEIDFDL